MALGGVIILAVALVKSTLSATPGGRFRLNVLLRILANHLQLTALTGGMNLQWPGALDAALGSTIPVVSIPNRLVAFDCLLDWRSADGSGGLPIDPLFIRLIVAFVLPWVLLGCVWLTWHFRFLHITKRLRQNRDKYFYKIKELRRERNARCYTTSIVLLFLMHPVIVTSVFN